MKIGILHPGSMGTELGKALAINHQVLWAGAGRSDQTRRRAIDASFTESPALSELVTQADVIISVCPPHAALEVSEQVASVRRRDFLYIDANTVAPDTMRSIASRFAKDVVADVALTGSPGGDNLTAWIAGPRGAEVCDLFDTGPITTRIVGDEIGQASAFKMRAGLRSKVIPAIWATLIDAAKAFGPEVEHALTQHLQDIGYDLDREAARVAERAPKAWRWIGEMEESARAMNEVGMPAGFSYAAAETYRRLAEP